MPYFFYKPKKSGSLLDLAEKVKATRDELGRMSGTGKTDQVWSDLEHAYQELCDLARNALFTEAVEERKNTPEVAL